MSHNTEICPSGPSHWYFGPRGYGWCDIGSRGVVEQATPALIRFRRSKVMESIRYADRLTKTSTSVSWNLGRVF